MSLDLVLGRQYIIKHQRSCSSLKLYWEQVMYTQLRNSIRYTWAVNYMTVPWSLFQTSLRCTCASHLRSQHSGSWGRKIAFEFETTFDYTVKHCLKTKEKAQKLITFRKILVLCLVLFLYWFLKKVYTVFFDTVSWNVTVPTAFF